MNRKRFLQISSLSLLTSLSGKGLSSQDTHPNKEDREYYEIRKYEIQAGEKSKRFDDYLKEILIPRFNDKGIGPIGVFSAFYGSNRLTLFLLIPYKSFELFLDVQENMLTIDDKIVEIIDYSPSISDPLYLSINNSLLKAFAGMPKLKIPDMTKNNKSRIFELRTYQSPNKKDSRKKIEMFNDGGEISIFNRTGMQPVFFGETLVGENLPNLVYMLAFKNILDLDRIWKQFWFDSEWVKLRNQSEYQNIVSDRRSLILRPKNYSQI